MVVGNRHASWRALYFSLSLQGGKKGRNEDEEDVNSWTQPLLVCVDVSSLVVVPVPPRKQLAPLLADVEPLTSFDSVIVFPFSFFFPFACPAASSLHISVFSFPNQNDSTRLGYSLEREREIPLVPAIHSDGKHRTL